MTAMSMLPFVVRSSSTTRSRDALVNDAIASPHGRAAAAAVAAAAHSCCSSSSSSSSRSADGGRRG
jgi:hypothetical protein